MQLINRDINPGHVVRADELADFYAGPLGGAVQAMVQRRLFALWPHLNGRHVLSLGYGIPFLTPYEGRAGKIVYALPELMGAPASGAAGQRNMVVTQGHRLPFPPGVFDTVLVTHALEDTPRLPAMLSELWRVLEPEGRVVIIAANRAGLWARADNNPLGDGRPYSRKQLSRALRAANFQPMRRAGAVYAPPFTPLCRPRLAKACEVVGETLWPGLSGLILVEAIKRLYAVRGGKARDRALRPLSGATPIGANGQIAAKLANQNRYPHE